MSVDTLFRSQAVEEVDVCGVVATSVELVRSVGNDGDAGPSARKVGNQSKTSCQGLSTLDTIGAEAAAG